MDAMEKTSQRSDEAQRRIGEFAVLHLGHVAGWAGDMADSIVEDEISVSLLPYDPEHRREELLDKIVARLDYVSSGLADLRAAELLAGRRNQGCPDTGQGEKSEQAQS